MSSDDDQITLNLDDGMSSSSMSQARALFDEIININTKITIIKSKGVTESEEISELRFIRKYLKDRMKFYENGGKV
jgi:hypothetical protein